MNNMVTNVYLQFNYDQFCIDKALENFQKPDNNKHNKNNIRSAWGPFPESKNVATNLCADILEGRRTDQREAD